MKFLPLSLIILPRLPLRLIKCFKLTLVSLQITLVLNQGQCFLLKHTYIFIHLTQASETFTNNNPKLSIPIVEKARFILQS